jgi:hypothetical protein
MRTRIVVWALFAAAACSRNANDSAQWLTDPGFAGHAKYFPLVGSVHDGIDCNSCHQAPASAPAFTTFAQVDCVTCHFAQATTPDAIHVGTVSGYVSPTAPTAPASPWPYSSQMCLTCHPNGTSIMADHGRFFPIGSGTSHNLGCSQCHGNPIVKQDLSKQQCNVCHVANDTQLATVHAQTSIGGDYSNTTPLACLRCHALDQLTTVAGHPSFNGQGLPHRGATCLRCHDSSLRTDLVASPMPGTTTAQPYATDFSLDPRGGATCTPPAGGTGCYAAQCHQGQCPPSGN